MLISSKGLVIDGRCCITRSTAGHCGGLRVEHPHAHRCFHHGYDLRCFNRIFHRQQQTERGYGHGGCFQRPVCSWGGAFDILGVTWQDILLTAILTVPTFILVLVKRKDLLVFAFDPQHASVVGLNTKWLHYGLLCILSLIIVASIKAVGIILVISVLIAPGAISYLLANRFDHMLAWSVLITTVSSLCGITLSSQKGILRQRKIAQTIITK